MAKSRPIHTFLEKQDSYPKRVLLLLVSIYDLAETQYIKISYFSI